MHHLRHLVHPNGLGPTNSQKDDKKLVQNLLQKDLKLPKALADVDKLHRMGRIWMNEWRKENIIVGFKSHAARYDISIVCIQV